MLGDIIADEAVGGGRVGAESGEHCLGSTIMMPIFKVVLHFIVQLDWPWIAEWAYAGIFAVAIRFQNQGQSWISHKKSGVVFFSSEKGFLVVSVLTASLKNFVKK